MLRVRVVLGVMGVLGVAAGPARAQIVNVQGALAKPPEHDDIVGQVEGKLRWREGNNPLFDIGGAGSIVMRRGPVLGLVLARGEYGTNRGVTLARKSFEHVRTRIEIDDRWRWEVFAQHEYDQFRRLSLRALAGTGPAFQAVATQPIGVLVGASYLFEYERLDRRANVSDPGVRTIGHRASVYVTGQERVGTAITVIETVYVQPRLDRPSDLRMLGELAVLSKLSTHLALKNSLTAAYDATPPDGIKRYDTALELALVATF